MKKSSAFLKHIVSMICSMAKSRTLAIKSKTNAMKARLIVFSLLRNKKLSLGSISHKIHAILGHQDNNNSNNNKEDDDKAIVLYNALTNEPMPSSLIGHRGTRGGDASYRDDDGDDEYPDLRHSLFDEGEDELDLGDPDASVIEFVRNSKEEGEDFKLEDEIDHVADLFIMKFHKRIRMQKLESFKRYQDMIERSA